MINWRQLKNLVYDGLIYAAVVIILAKLSTLFTGNLSFVGLFIGMLCFIPIAALVNWYFPKIGRERNNSLTMYLFGYAKKE